MLDLLLAVAVTAPVYPARPEQRAPLVVFGREITAATERVGLALSLDELLRSSAATFRFGLEPQEERRAERTRSVTVTVTYVMGGLVKRPPLDDQIVYFDE
jgi:hypothetical protein